MSTKEEHTFLVQTSKGKGSYKTRYSFTVKSLDSSQAWLYYSSINVGPNNNKRLLRDGKVIARCFG